ncbi:Vesicle transport through interaction with t-SNAREs-like protein 1B [Carpediemonas membranifera]|uniref:Vesicle transport through interaction with t-SNAREs-like protein 1B n=1 Tax=Carpediemonas membranifera TaxID=201153 RepID=A0A8J6AYR2_9EUKA|nr:Vesicle transport through interaction with t-SNAREs-like protein 1B [Carpediemonas membranifera]|eukprot:KAG9397318.1 Vesicle transport through interaction with t-SNAREs-like protein 1B [Carpediemonas membranifera]
MFKPQSSRQEYENQYATLTPEEAERLDNQQTQRKKLLGAHEALTDGVTALREANTMGDETAQITHEIMYEVDRQGKIISGARDKNKSVQDRLKDGRKLARAMLRREYLSKIILLVLFLLLVSTLGIVLWWKFIQPQIKKITGK